MTILVTGGAGYIGSIVTEELLKEKYGVVVLDNLQQGHREAVLPGTIFIEGDLGNKILLDSTFHSYNIDAVIHMAAETVVEYSMTDRQRYFKNDPYLCQNK